MNTKVNPNAADIITCLTVKSLRCYIANGIPSAYRLGPRAIRVDVDDIAEDTRTGSPLSIPAIAPDDTALGAVCPMLRVPRPTRAVIVGSGDRRVMTSEAPGRDQPTGGLLEADTAATAAHRARRWGSGDQGSDLVDAPSRTIRRRMADGSITGYCLGPRNLLVDLSEVAILLNPISTPATGR